jgi:SAM-dependent methyltransferase
MSDIAIRMNDIYRCPRTGRSLRRVSNGIEVYETLEGSIRYPIRHGVPNFRLVQTEPADEPRLVEIRNLDELGEIAAREGWRTAIEQRMPHLLAYIDRPDRAMFLDELPLHKDAVALEIGPGLGQLLIPLAQRVKAAYGLELAPGQARFALERARQTGCDNVQIAAGGDDLLLPFADGVFDIVVMNNVLEWLRLPGRSVATVDAQRLMLSEIRRVLRPGGVAFISTKNRFGLRLLLGGRDEHMGEMRFGQALPRRVSYALARKRPGLRGLLHSYEGLASLLREVGLTPTRSLWGAPDSRFPARYVPTDAESVKRARQMGGFAQGTTRGTRLVMPFVPAALVKHVAPGLTFVVERKPLEATTRSAVMDQVHDV